MEIIDLSEEGKNIIQVEAEGTDTPYSAYGRYYIRINDADILMDSSQLQKFFEEKGDNYLKWEETDTCLSANDIDEDLLIDIIRNANEKGRLNYVYRNANETLNKLGLLSEHRNLNNAGLYLFGKNKPLTIKEAFFPTDTRTEFGEIKEFRGNIFECIQETMSYIQNHISYKSNIVGVQREEIPEIPIRAIREIVVNSFAHCSYARIGDFNQYIIYKSSIRIYNPGSIIKGLDPIKFSSGLVGSKIRNLLIASTLFKCGDIDAFGTGFDRTFALCNQNNISYEYYEDEFDFTFVFNRNINFLSDKTNDKINAKKTLDEEILFAIKSNKHITIPELSNLTGKSEITIHRHLDFLVKKNIVLRVGSRKTGYWEIINK